MFDTAGDLFGADLGLRLAFRLDALDACGVAPHAVRRTDEAIAEERARRADIYARRAAELGVTYRPYEWVDAATTRRREAEMDRRLRGRTLFGDTHLSAISGYFDSDVELDEAAVG